MTCKSRHFQCYNHCNNSLELLEYRAKEYHIEIKNNPHQLIYCDATLIEQVIINLLLNAFEASPINSKITIRSSNDEYANIIEIIDQGCGIKTKDLSKVTELFYSTKYHGTGLGLSICSQIIQQHDGSLTFQNNELGTTVRIELPRF